MRRSKGSNHPVARRVAMASMTVLAASGIGLVAAPMAFGQIVIPIGGPILGSGQNAGVTNSGSASANTGGNVAIGNNSTNTVTAGGTGGLISVPVELGTSANTSTGEAAVTTGPATAVGNQAGTGVNQSNASGNQVNSFLAGQRQGAGVTNAGSASANSGGNAAIGNNSTNTLTVPATAGLVAVGVNLGGSVNNSTGQATINSGAANATGNNSSTEVGQASLQGGAATRAGVGAVAGIGGAGVGAGPCNVGRFGSFQDANVRNQGQAEANTGNNVAIGNNSTNNANLAGAGQTVSGSLVAVGISIGGPVNNSSGTAVINTGPANAVGNNSSTEVGQVQGCPQVVTLAAGGRPGVIVPAGHVHVVQKVGTATLARTGLDTGDLGMIAGALLAAGGLLIASQRRRAQARALAAAVPMAGFGFGLGADDWDRTVR